RQLRRQRDRHPLDPDSPPPGLFLREPSADLAEGPSSSPPTHRPSGEKFRRMAPAARGNRDAGPARPRAAHHTDRRVADGLPGETDDCANDNKLITDPAGHQPDHAADQSATTSR